MIFFFFLIYRNAFGQHCIVIHFPSHFDMGILKNGIVFFKVNLKNTIYFFLNFLFLKLKLLARFICR